MTDNANWLSELPSVNKKYNKRIHSSTKMTPIQDSERMNENLLYSNLRDDREVQTAKNELGQLVRTADVKNSIL